MISKVRSLVALILVGLFLVACGPSEYEETKLRAEEGDAEAQYRLHRMYEREDKPEESERWLAAAFDQGFPRARSAVASIAWDEGDKIEAIRLWGLVVDNNVENNSEPVMDPTAGAILLLGGWEDFGAEEKVSLIDEMGQTQFLTLSESERQELNDQRDLDRLRAIRYAICAVLYSVVGSQEGAELFAKGAGYYATEGRADPESVWTSTSALAQEVFLNQAEAGGENRDGAYFEIHHDSCTQLATGDPAAEAVAAQAGR